MPLFSSGNTPVMPPTPTSAAKDAPQGPSGFSRAAALTYRTAPHPSDSTDGVFEALLMLAADRLNPNGEAMKENSSSGASHSKKGSWFGRAWRHVVDYATNNLLKMRQADFLNAFSRQLEVNPAEESSTVMVSCQCFIVSGGKLRFGSLFATNCGFSAGLRGAEDEVEYIKERILFTDVASLLPSIFLEQNGTATPFIQGIPNGVVAPTALQVFTVQLSTVLQFLHLHNVGVKRPKRSAAEAEKGGAGAVQEAPCIDVVQKHEFNLVCELPPSLDTLKFCALLWRLWAQRLHDLGRPLEHPAVHYAEPH
ncbi:hypothetical protein CGC21_29415 [Leishmania donovani]|uniref:Uncharacterized protein n=1 Tax=Leishmania donovani TaxID=5661 RepID=A0A504XXT5_LEIDO|nr:hypothetical protein CGC21_29415 [Leishmania donovani]